MNKLFLRYFFEVIVIIFSITASFYIQELLSEKEKEHLKNEALKGVLLELEKDRGFMLGFGEQYNTWRIKSIDSLFDERYTYSDKWMGTIWGNSALFGNNRFFESLVSTGGIEHIKSIELQSQLSSYYNNQYSLLIQASELDTDSYIRFSDNLVNYKLDSIKYNWPGGSSFYFDKTDVEKIRNDVKLKSIAMQWKIWLFEFNKRISLTLEKNNLLVELITDELSNSTN